MYIGTFIGIGTTEDLKCYLHKNNISAIATPNTVQFIEIDNVKYHGGWMKPVGEDITALLVTIDQITEEEYNAIFGTIEKAKRLKLLMNRLKNR